MIEPGKYREVGEPVEAIQLAPGNVLDVCAWIEEGGASAWLDEKAGLLAIRDQDDTHPWSGSLAWIGDWITKGSRGYRAVPSGYFAEHYERADWVDDETMSAEDTVARFDALHPLRVRQERWRKRAVEVEAVRLTEDNIEAVFHLVVGAGESATLTRGECPCLSIFTPSYVAAKAKAGVGDWVVREASEFHAVPNDVFRAAYERWAASLPPVGAACRACAGAGYIDSPGRTTHADETTTLMRLECWACHGAGRA